MPRPLLKRARQELPWLALESASQGVRARFWAVRESTHMTEERTDAKMAGYRAMIFSFR